MYGSYEWGILLKKWLRTMPSHRPTRTPEEKMLRDVRVPCRPETHLLLGDRCRWRLRRRGAKPVQRRLQTGFPSTLRRISHAWNTRPTTRMSKRKPQWKQLRQTVWVLTGKLFLFVCPQMHPRLRGQELDTAIHYRLLQGTACTMSPGTKKVPLGHCSVYLVSRLIVKQGKL